MAKRENNYSRTKDRADFKDPENIEMCLSYLENVGKLKAKMVLPPRFITPRCIIYYDNVIQVNSILETVVDIPDSKLNDQDSLLNTLRNDSTASEINIKFINKMVLVSDSNKYFVNRLKENKTDLQTKIINLSSIVIGSVIKKFPTLYPTHYEDVFTACAVDILDKINKNKYDRTKSAYHSYMYESSYQACVKYIAEKAKYENHTVQLLQD